MNSENIRVPRIVLHFPEVISGEPKFCSKRSVEKIPESELHELLQPQNLFRFCILCEFCSDCANFVQIVRKVVLIFSHKKNRTKNKALCSSFVRIFCSF